MAFIKAFAPWNLPKVPCSATGSDEVKEYQAVLEKNGSYILKETGKKVNIQAKIQSHANDCDLSLILQSMNEAGIDLSNGVSITDDINDYTDMQSTSIHDRMKAMQDYEKNLEYYKAELEKLKAENNTGENTGENGGEN